MQQLTTKEIAYNTEQTIRYIQKICRRIGVSKKNGLYIISEKKAAQIKQEIKHRGRPRKVD